MGGYTPRAAVNPLDEVAYLDGAPGSSWWGRELINNDRTLFANIGRVPVNEPILPLTKVGYQDTNVVTDPKATPLWSWPATQGHNTLRYWVRLQTGGAGVTVRLHPLTAATQNQLPHLWSQAVVGTGAEQTVGPYDVPIWGGQDEHFRLIIMVEPAGDRNDTAFTDEGAIAAITQTTIQGAAGAFAGWAAWTRMIRIVKPAGAVDPRSPLTEYHLITEVTGGGGATPIVTIKEPFGEGHGERPMATVGSVPWLWESYALLSVTILTIMGVELPLTTAEQMLRA